VTAPYREYDPPPRFICIVCYETVSTAEGTCHGAPLQPIENQEILTELRRRAEAKKERPDKIKYATIFGGSIVCSILVHAVLLGTGVYDLNPRRGGLRYGAGGDLMLYLMLTFFVFTILFVYVVKWTGLFRPTAAAVEFDPETADVLSLLKWLDLRPKSAA
jgi:hypothetical protein